MGELLSTMTKLYSDPTDRIGNPVARGVVRFVAVFLAAVLILIGLGAAGVGPTADASPINTDGSACPKSMDGPDRTACRYRHDRIGHSRNKPWASDKVRHAIIHRHNRNTRQVESRMESRDWWGNFKDGVTCAFYGHSSLNAIGCAGSVMGAEIRDLSRWSFICGGAGVVGQYVTAGGRVTPLGLGGGAAACVFLEYRRYLVKQIFPRELLPT